MGFVFRLFFSPLPTAIVGPPKLSCLLQGGVLSVRILMPLTPYRRKNGSYKPVDKVLLKLWYRLSLFEEDMLVQQVRGGVGVGPAKALLVQQRHPCPVAAGCWWYRCSACARRAASALPVPSSASRGDSPHPQPGAHSRGAAGDPFPLPDHVNKKICNSSVQVKACSRCLTRRSGTGTPAGVQKQALELPGSGEGGRVCALHHGASRVLRLRWGEEQCTDPTCSRLGHASRLPPGALQTEQGGSAVHLRAPEAQHTVLRPDGGRGHGQGADTGGQAVRGDPSRPCRWELSCWLSCCGSVSGPACGTGTCGGVSTHPSAMVAQ